jgi:hypothetical protein
MIPLWQMVGNVIGLLYLSMRASHIRALSGDSKTNMCRAFLTSSSVTSIVLSLDRLRLDNDAVMVSGEMLRLDVFGGYEVMVVRVVGVADRWSDRLVDGDWVG